MKKALKVFLIIIIAIITSAENAWAYNPPYPGALATKQTVVALGPEYNCLVPTEGWRCQDVRYGTTNNKFRISYNLPSVTPSSHVVFSTGSYFGSYSPAGMDTKVLMDKMAASPNNVRSYEINVTSLEPSNLLEGAPNASAVLTALVEYISAQHASNNKVKLITYDYSATLASYGLAYRGLESKVSQVILLGGPAGFNYSRELFDSSAPSYITAADRLVKIDGHNIIDAIKYVNGWLGTPKCLGGFYAFYSCQDHLSLSSASMFTNYYEDIYYTDYDGYSYFSHTDYYNDVPFAGVDLNYPGVKINNIVGANDLSWFKTSSKYWYDRISAASKTRDVMPGVDHNVFSSDDVIQKILGYLSLVDVNLGSAIASDLTVPTTPTTVQVQQPNTTNQSVTVTISGGTDNVGISHYEVYRDGVFVGIAAPNTVFTDNTVSLGTSYTYTSITVDLANNKSVLSSPSNITTSGTAPTSSGSGGGVSVASQNPSIITSSTYSLEQGVAFDKNNFSSLTCTDSQDGIIKNNLVVTTIVPIPANPTIGDSYVATLDCTDSEGNVADQRLTTINIVSPGGTPAPTAPSTPSTPPNAPPAPNPITYGIPTVPGTQQVGGLVNCGDAGEPACQFCHLVSMIDGTLQWLVTVLSIIAAIFFLVSGLRMVVSTGDVQAKQSAKKMVINTAIGFIIVLSAWMVIDLILQSLVDLSFTPAWNTISCVNQPLPNTPTP